MKVNDKKFIFVNGSCVGGINCQCNRNRKRSHNLKKVAAKQVRQYFKAIISSI